MMHSEKHQCEKDLVLVGQYRKSPASARYYIFAPVVVMERYKKDAFFRFQQTKKDDLIMAATNLFEGIVNIHPFEDRIFQLILTCLYASEVLSISSAFKLFP